MSQLFFESTLIADNSQEEEAAAVAAVVIVAVVIAATTFLSFMHKLIKMIISLKNKNYSKTPAGRIISNSTENVLSLFFFHSAVPAIPKPVQVEITSN